jgi:uncharacterized protein (TIGR02145 family)
MNHSFRYIVIPILLIGLTLILTSCTPKPTLAVVTTANVTGITQTTATAGGNVTSDGNADVTSRGVCWGTAQNPTTSSSKTSDGTGTGTFTSSMTGLTANTKYYIRAYANNSTGTAYGDEKSFTTEPIKTVTDIDGNVYNTTTIGTQVWMVENLKVTKYRNGDAIPNVTDNAQWQSLTTGAYCNYDNNATNATAYGRLYNWHAVGTGNLCPTGWHVPADTEWATLRDYLIANGYNFDGSTGANAIAKSLASATGWQLSALPGTVGNTDYPEKRNATGFTALPGGSRGIEGGFSYIGDMGSWWLSTEIYDVNAWYLFLGYDYISVVDTYNFSKNGGFSVRCLKN